MKPIEEIEVIDPEEVSPETNVDSFYQWLIKIGNVYLSDNEQIVKSFNIVK